MAHEVNFWDFVACSKDVHDVREAILAGYMQGKPFVAHAPVCLWPEGLRDVFDFGCGLGRNFDMLLQRSTGTLYAYDRPTMLLRAKTSGQTFSARVLFTEFLTPLIDVHLVFMSLVLQHMKPTDIRDAFMQLPRHRYLSIVTRARHDEGGPTLAHVPLNNYRLLEAREHIINVRVGSDEWPSPSGGQHLTLDEMTLNTSERHFELLLERVRA